MLFSAINNVFAIVFLSLVSLIVAVPAPEATFNSSAIVERDQIPPVLGTVTYTYTMTGGVSIPVCNPNFSDGNMCTL